MRTGQCNGLLTGVVCALCGALAGCESAQETKQPLLFFPAPPAAPRIQYLTYASGVAQIEPQRSSFQEFILGEEPRARLRIDKPYGIAASNGVVYVCDTKGLCLCRLDFREKTFSILGTRGPGRLRKPINITMDSLGYKFVADPVRQQIVIFDPDDKYVTAFDVPKPCRPVDVAVYKEEVYVLDNDETCQIVVMDRSTGEVLRTLGGPGGAPGEFKIPNSLCVDPEGFLYVSDTHNFRIQKLKRNGEAVWVKGTPGYRLGQFGRPRGVRTGPDGTLYMADGATEIIQMWDPQGNILMRFGGPGAAPGALVLPATVAVDSTSIPYFAEYIHKDFTAEYLVFVTNQYGPYLVNVYAFGSFPEGYNLSETDVQVLPRIGYDEDEGLGTEPIEDSEATEETDEGKPRLPRQEPG